jgi:hypothetical protein
VNATSDTLESPHVLWWAAVLGGMLVLGVLAFADGAYHFWSNVVTAALPQGLLRGVFVAALLTHAAEAWYAFHLAGRVGLNDSRAGWVVQTFLLGYPSLRFLRARARHATSP